MNNTTIGEALEMADTPKAIALLSWGVYHALDNPRFAKRYRQTVPKPIHPRTSTASANYMKGALVEWIANLPAPIAEYLKAQPLWND